MPTSLFTLLNLNVNSEKFDYDWRKLENVHYNSLILTIFKLEVFKTEPIHRLKKLNFIFLKSLNIFIKV